MGRRAALPENQTNIAAGMLQGGMTVKSVAHHFGINVSKISRLRDRFNVTGSV